MISSAPPVPVVFSSAPFPLRSKVHPVEEGPLASPIGWEGAPPMAIKILASGASDLDTAVSTFHCT